MLFARCSPSRRKACSRRKRGRSARRKRSAASPANKKPAISGGLEFCGSWFCYLMIAPWIRSYSSMTFDSPAAKSSRAGNRKDARFNRKRERCLVFKSNGDPVVVGFYSEFHEVNNFAFDLGKVMLIASQFAPPSVDWSGLRSCPKHGRIPS